MNPAGRTYRLEQNGVWQMGEDHVELLGQCVRCNVALRRLG
jgi:hypothetical protein